MALFPQHSLVSVGLCLTGTLVAQAQNPPRVVDVPSTGKEPAQLGVEVRQASNQVTNQQLADEIARRLRETPTLQGYRVDILANRGSIYLTGEVVNSTQQEEIIRLVRSMPGVVQVQCQVGYRQPNAITPTQALDPIPGTQPRKEGPILPPGEQSGGNPAGPPEPTNILQGGQAGAPQGFSPGPMANAYNPPRMPPYAWPTYAPYNNFSRVGYPTLYPYQSWPFIGPMYPFPKIPPGWRSIHLTWEDGHWWYGRNSSGHDWWRVRYW